MTKTNSSTTQKTKTEQIQEYLERDLPRSVLIDAYRTGKHEPIVKYVKEHYGQSTISYKATADFIGIELAVRDAIQNIALTNSPYKDLAQLPSYAALVAAYGEQAAFAINGERNFWLKVFERLGATMDDLERIQEAIAVRDVLKGLRGMYVQDCWCDAEGESEHREACKRASKLYDVLTRE